MIRAGNLLLFYLVFKYRTSWGCEKHENRGENGTFFHWETDQNLFAIWENHVPEMAQCSGGHLSLGGHSDPPVSAALTASESVEPASESIVGHTQAFFKSNTHYEATDYFLFIFPFF